MSRAPGSTSRTCLRARGRFTRNFVVQASAADWALVLSQACTAGSPSWPISADRLVRLVRPGPWMARSLLFFQHDEVIVHCPRAAAPEVVTAIGAAAHEAGRLLFGATPVRFPVTTAVVNCYADAK